MALTSEGLIAASAATTAATGAEAKVKALAAALIACVAEVSGSKQPLSPSAQVKVSDIAAEFDANAAEFQTALGL